MSTITATLAAFTASVASMRASIEAQIQSIADSVATALGAADTATTKAAAASSDKTAAQAAATTATNKATIATDAADYVAGAVSTATTAASTATGAASTATTQAGIATTKAGDASTAASTATTQAGIATDRATEAAASAALAATYSSGSGTVSAGTSGQLAKYASNSNVVSGQTVGSGVLTALGVAVGTDGAFVVKGGVLGTPSGGDASNLTNIPMANAKDTLDVAHGGTGVASLTGIVKGAGASAFAPATAGSDYVEPGTATTFTAKQTFSGTTSAPAMSIVNAVERPNVVAAAPQATQPLYVNLGLSQWFTTNAANNWVFDIAFSSGTTLDNGLATGDQISFAVSTEQSGTAYYCTGIKIDGVTQTVRWIGGAPTAGNASGQDIYSIIIRKTAAATYKVTASLSQAK